MHVCVGVSLWHRILDERGLGVLVCAFQELEQATVLDGGSCCGVGDDMRGANLATGGVISFGPPGIWHRIAREDHCMQDWKPAMAES